MKRPLPRAIAALGSLAVAGALGMPGDWVPEVSPRGEFVAHAAAFAGGVGLWLWAFPHRWRTVVAVALAVAVASEGLQATVVPLRSGSAIDALANGVGVGLACALAWARTGGLNPKREPAQAAPASRDAEDAPRQHNAT